MSHDVELVRQEQLVGYERRGENVSVESTVYTGS